MAKSGGGGGRGGNSNSGSGKTFRVVADERGNRRIEGQPSKKEMRNLIEAAENNRRVTIRGSDEKYFATFEISRWSSGDKDRAYLNLIRSNIRELSFPGSNYIDLRSGNFSINSRSGLVVGYYASAFRRLANP